MTARAMRRAASACAAAFLPALLGGCFGATDHPVAGLEPAAVESPVAMPPIRTVRPAGGRPVEVADPAPRGDALPTAAEIFDFHPAGSKPGAWRQPFVIDPNDGPLAGYVRRMDAELVESNRQTAAAAAARPVRKRVCPADGPSGPIAAACGENAVAGRLAR